MSIAIALVVVLFATIMLFVAADYAAILPLTVAGNEWISAQFNYQLMLLFLAGATLLAVHLQNPQAFRQYFSIGRISAPANQLRVFGVRQGESWLRVGAGMGITVTLLTCVLIYIQRSDVELNQSFLYAALGWVLLFSLMNAFSEEVIFRLALVVPLQGQLSANSIAMLSGFIFGIAHVGGSPGGVSGMLLAGLLGWLLARSMLETRGLFWAVLIHFVQDLVIFSAFMLQVSKF